MVTLLNRIETIKKLAATAQAAAQATAAQVQSITIDTPPPGTQVGSPMTLTGWVARSPNQGLLSAEFALESAGIVPALR
jgi:hypothetical protein